MKRILMIVFIAISISGIANAQLYKKQLEFSATSDQTISLGRYRIGTLIDIKLSVSGGWAEDGGSYQISAAWGQLPKVIYRGESDISTRLKFHGYKESNGYAYLFATWENQSPTGQNNVLKLTISSNSEFTTNLLGNFSNAVELENILTVVADGYVGIGTTSPSHKLSVNGDIRSKELNLENENWPDYVFTDDYELKPLTEVSNFIANNGHLPNIPSAKEVESNGIELSKMNASLLEKIEELTLYTIDQDNKLKNQEALILSLIERIEKLEK